MVYRTLIYIKEPYIRIVSVSQIQVQNINQLNISILNLTLKCFKSSSIYATSSISILFLKSFLVKRYLSMVGFVTRKKPCSCSYVFISSEDNSPQSAKVIYDCFKELFGSWNCERWRWRSMTKISKSKIVSSDWEQSDMCTHYFPLWASNKRQTPCDLKRYEMLWIIIWRKLCSIQYFIPW